MFVKNKNFVILGIQKSGYSIAKFLLNNGSKCYLYEDKENDEINNSINDLVGLGAEKTNYEFLEKNIDLFDGVILSPGVAISHPVAILFKENKKFITGEFDFSFLLSMPTYVGITGTNGKTTTVTLIGEILKEANIQYKLIGNIGIPFSSKINEINKDDFIISEISSFQLETINCFSPHIACILNITPDHLERHFSMENYTYLKSKVLSNLTYFDYAILNYDDEIVKSLSNNIKTNVIYVSKNKLDNGGYIKDDCFYYNDEKICETNLSNLIGEHNLYNVLFSVVVCKLLNIDNEIIKNVIMSFKGVNHRIEMVLEKDGVVYYNDSKATNTASTIVAINSMKRPTVLILGGSEKGENYINLFNEIKNSLVKHVIITGASRFNMMKDAGKTEYSNITVIPDFEYAIKISKMYASSGDAILFSPATASFDNFKNYMERGEKFVEIIKQD